MIFNFISVIYSTYEHLRNLEVIKYDNRNPLVIIFDNLTFSGGDYK